jgi:hypothetical protein
MAKVEYPKMLYKGGETIIVKSEDEHAALGDGWNESPIAEEPAPDEEAAPIKGRSKK